jgi:hypothetical protein
MQIERDPYRSASLVVVQAHVERAFCPWCAHLAAYDMRCTAPSKCAPCGLSPRCTKVNTDGTCDSYQPSLWTRLMRRFGRRSALLLARGE